MDDLTPTQREAVLHEGGPLLIIAGAGTGKTTVITRRMAWLITTNRAQPHEVLALTFTDKAAAEMEERVDLLVPYGYVDVSIRTFHAFGDELLRDHALNVGLTPNFRVLSHAEQLVFLRQHVFELPLDTLRPLTDPTRFLELLARVFARAKDEAVSPEQFLVHAQDVQRQAEAAPHDPSRIAEARRTMELARGYAAYRQLLRQADAVDFGDQVLLAIELLEGQPDVLAAVRSRFRYLLIDEFQDTNYAQFRLLQLLAHPTANVTVVADDDQCLPRGTLISTPQGSRPIEEIARGQEVFTAVGKGHVGIQKVTRVFRSTKSVRLLTFRTREGRTISVTDNHKMFAFIPSVASRRDLHYVYLMHRQDVGWRLGVTNDLATRLRLERSADRIIGIQRFASDSEARFHETFWSLRYGIPTTVFKIREGVAIQGELLTRLHTLLDTNHRVERLARDLHVDLHAHHVCLDGVHRGSSHRVKINLSMCARRYRATHSVGTILKQPSILHTVRIQTSNPEAAAKLKATGVPVHAGPHGVTVSLAFADLKEAGAMAERLAQAVDGILETTCSVGRFHTEHTPALLMPAKNVLCGQYLPVLDAERAQVLYDEVVAVDETVKTCEVFDLEVDRTHNFIADGVVVHNSIYKWRGAAISNVLKFLDHYTGVRTVVLTENFRSSQPLLDCAYRLIRFNDPDRLEARQGINKKLIARATHPPAEPRFHVFDDVSSEADWVARTIREAVESGSRHPGDFAILVRSNREADLFLRALNVAGIPWQFSGSSALFAREESKMLLSCLKALADPDDSVSWYHVASSPLYRCPMDDLAKALAQARKTNQSLRAVIERLAEDPALDASLSEEGKRQLGQLVTDRTRLLELSRTHSSGQVLYRWLTDQGLLAALSRAERLEDALRLQTIAQFFQQLRRVEGLAGERLPELMQHLELFQAMGNEPLDEDDAWADRVNVFTIHKAKGLEFPVVFLVGLVQGRFPTPQRRDPIELPESLIQDLLPSGNYHLQEERRLFYVGMTRAKEQLYLTCAYDYGGKTVRKVSQFVLEAMDLATPSPPARRVSARELIERSETKPPIPVSASPRASRQTLRLDPHGVDDYRTCPLKYRYSHLLNIPVMRHHLVAYGAALHKAVELFFTRQLRGVPMSEAELLTTFERQWSSEGFLTREHETLRLTQGREALKRFFARQQEAPEHPTLIEGRFKFPLDDLLIVGRWDRVDRREQEVVIIDYKSSEVDDQGAADRRARESLQMLIYALAWQTLHGELPRVELRFLETGVTGHARFTNEDLDRARTVLRNAAQGIRAQDFHAQPQEFTCRWCAFQSICPFAFQAR
ncbi:MAG: UvrD-helicase domain-containing protein [Candidatus Omnitrophica bacterium]|nr:UvrD-helicase domain-containing protein [Candidatus Omnitrophota bacterium]